MGDVIPFKKKSNPHDWGPSRLNHGSKQCKKCLCTYEEAFYALGMECKKE